MNKLLRMWLVAVISATAGLCMVWSGTAQAASSNDSETKKIMAAQAPLMSAADELEAFITKNNLSGLGGVQLDVPGGHVLLYWKGTVPDNLNIEIKRLNGKASIKLLPARYTLAEEKKQAKTLVQDKKKFGHLRSITAKTDGSGLEVGMDDASKKAPGSYGIDAKEVVEPSAKPFSRRDNSPYYSAGGSFSIPKITPVTPDNHCSAGFATYRTVYTPLPSVQTSILSAAHCDGFTNLNTQYSAGKEIMGRSIMVNEELDSLVIETQSAARTYDGGVADGTEFFKPVTGKGTNRVGTYVCTSGGAEGIHCNLKISKTNTTHQYSQFVEVHDLVEAVEVNGGIAAGEGDSGGPVFALSADPSKVLAMGLISGGPSDAQHAVNCKFDGDYCANTVYFSDINNVLSAHGLTLMTANTIYAQPQLVSLQSAQPTSHYMRHTNYLGYAAIPSDANIKRESTFWLRSGLNNPAATVSLEAFAPAQNFFRHQGFRIKLNPSDGTQLFKDDASFYPDAGLSNAGRGYISFRSSNAPNYYIRHKNFELWVDPNDNTPVFKSDATWKITDPLVYQ